MGVSGFLVLTLVAFFSGGGRNDHHRCHFHHEDTTISIPSTSRSLPPIINHHFHQLQQQRQRKIQRSSNIIILFSQLYQQQVAKNVRIRYLDPLFETANIDTNFVSAQAMTDGFCNNVYRITITPENNDDKNKKTKTTTLVAKIFSDLAKKRIDPSQPLGEIDHLLDREHLGPHIIAQTSDALLMEHIDGTVLNDSLLFGRRQKGSNSKGNNDDNDRNSLNLCAQVGDALGRMHSLKPSMSAVTTTTTTTKGPNMLWHAMDVMLSTIQEQEQQKQHTKPIQIVTDIGTKWSLSKLYDTVNEYQDYLELQNLPIVIIGHGDFKWSNILLENTTNDIRFIDFELSGIHYRGYDLAKFFRGYQIKPTTNNDKSSKNINRNNIHQQVFWASYHERISTKGKESSSLLAETITPHGIPFHLDAQVASQLEWEANLLEPMTWLEAVSFFLCMASSDDPSQKDRWMNLATDRLNSYEKMILLSGAKQKR